LSYRYFGPYEVEAKVGPITYKLKLPSHSSIHPAFHVSLLKKVTGKVDVPFSPLPLDTSPQQQLEMVLDRHVCTRSRRTYYQLLVKWFGWPPKLATWEDEDELVRVFPYFMAWGHAVAKEGDVTVRVKPPELWPKSKRPKKPNPKVFGPDWKA
jgi:hypothetical protein